MRRAQGFTLLEVTIALALGVVVAGTVTALYTQTLVESRRTLELAEMSRDATFVGQLLSRELRQAGLGVRIDLPPTAPARHTNDHYGTSAPATFYSGLLVGGASEVGILADFPRPDAQYPTYGMLVSRPTGPNTIMFLNENNGACAPQDLPAAAITAGASSCSTADSSVFFPGEAGCNATTGFADRTCPWGMRRLSPGERFQIFAANGSWVHAAVTATLTALVANAPTFTLALPLQASMDVAWPNTALGDGPGGFVGAGWVTTLDRVFYQHDTAAKTITRQQCWGDPDPGHANFPPANATAVPADPEYPPTVITGIPPPALTPEETECTEREVVARNVDSFTLRYFDATNPTNLAVTPSNTITKQSVRRIDYTIEFKKTVLGRALTHRVEGSVRLQNG